MKQSAEATKGPPEGPRLVSATFRLDREILEGLARVKERDGIPVAVQVRRALVNWLKARKALPSSTGKRRG